MNNYRLKKCYFKNENFFPCWMLTDRLNPEANVGRGLVQVNVQSIQDMTQGKKSICIGMVFKRTTKDTGLMCNFCPFCGSDVKGWERKEYQERKKNLEVKL